MGEGKRAMPDGPGCQPTASAVPASQSGIPIASHIVYGDWRDLRQAIEQADPTWQEKGEIERSRVWEFCRRLLDAYAPMKFQCWTCGAIRPLQDAYRCADCHSRHCGECIRPHFGPNHRRHG